MIIRQRFNWTFARFSNTYILNSNRVNVLNIFHPTLGCWIFSYWKYHSHCYSCFKNYWRILFWTNGYMIFVLNDVKARDFVCYVYNLYTGSIMIVIRIIGKKNLLIVPVQMFKILQNTLPNINTQCVLAEKCLPCLKGTLKLLDGNVS